MSTTWKVGVILVVGVAVTTGAGSDNFGRIDRVDVAIDRIVPNAATIEKVAGGFTFAEGPVWSRQGGYLLFSDIPNNVIYKWSRGDSKISVYRKPSGYDGSRAKPGAFIGSNGLTLDSEGRLVVCEHGNRRISRLEKNGKLTVLVDHARNRVTSPNDAVYKSDGSLYFTDPVYEFLERDASEQKDVLVPAVYRLGGGLLRLLSSDLTRPNGIAFSPDEKYLYIANSDPARKIWVRFEVTSDGGLANKIVFYDVTQRPEQGVPDGMKVDVEGNLYCTGPGGVWIFSAAGKHLGTIQLPEVPANCNWGDDDGKTLYITANKSIYRIRLNIAGIRP